MDDENENEISFVAPNGQDVGLLQEGGGPWRVIWEDDSDPESQFDYFDDGPDNDWESVDLLTPTSDSIGSPPGGTTLWVWEDMKGDRWLSRHLMRPDEAARMSDFAIQCARVDYQAALALHHALTARAEFPEDAAALLPCVDAAYYLMAKDARETWLRVKAGGPADPPAPEPVAYFKRPKGLPDDSHVVNNVYECPCGATWEDAWDCGCDDECPSCGKDVSPSESVDDPECDCATCTADRAGDVAQEAAEGEKRLHYWSANVDYQTAGGNAGTWRGTVEATDEDDAVAKSHAEARRARPALMSIVGGDVADLGPIPAKEGN